MKRNGSLHTRLATLCGAILLATLALGCAGALAPRFVGYLAEGRPVFGEARIFELHEIRG